MQNRIKGKKLLHSKVFRAMTFYTILVFSVLFMIKHFARTRFEQKKEYIDFFTLEKNIKWRGFEFFHGKNSTGCHFSQIDSAFYYDAEYTEKEFSQFIKQNNIKEMNFEEVLFEYKHFLKVYKLRDSALLSFQRKSSAAKVERPTVTIFIFWKLEGSFYKVRIVFFTL